MSRHFYLVNREGLKQMYAVENATDSMSKLVKRDIFSFLETIGLDDCESEVEEIMKNFNHSFKKIKYFNDISVEIAIIHSKLLKSYVIELLDTQYPGSAVYIHNLMDLHAFLTLNSDKYILVDEYMTEYDTWDDFTEEINVYT